MLSGALIDKYGYAQGLTIVDGKIKEWPSEWPEQPSKSELSQIEEDYAPMHAHKEELAKEGLSDFEEATMDAIGPDKYTQEWKDKHASKKQKRSERPEQEKK